MTARDKIIEAVIVGFTKKPGEEGWTLPISREMGSESKGWPLSILRAMNDDGLSFRVAILNFLAAR